MDGPLRVVSVDTLDVPEALAPHPSVASTEAMRPVCGARHFKAAAPAAACRDDDDDDDEEVVAASAQVTISSASEFGGDEDELKRWRVLEQPRSASYSPRVDASPHALRRPVRRPVSAPVGGGAGERVPVSAPRVERVAMARVEERLFMMTERLQLSRARKDILVNKRIAHEKKLREMGPVVEDGPPSGVYQHSQSGVYRQSRTDLRDELYRRADRVRHSAVTAQMNTKPYIINDQHQAYLVHRSFVRNVHSTIKNRLHPACEAQWDARKIARAKHVEGPLKGAREHRSRSRHELGVAASWGEPPPRRGGDPPSAANFRSASPVRPRGLVERQRLAFERSPTGYIGSPKNPCPQHLRF